MGRWLLRAALRFHNQVQLVAYEGANLVLFLAEGGASAAALSALCFALGSALIFLFHPERRAAFLMYGGLALTAGGGLLFASGFHHAGVAVMLASLETARGGLPLAHSRVARGVALVSGVRLYAALIARLVSLHRSLRVLNERPFVVGAALKAPMRTEVVLRSLLHGDLVTAVVGLGWLVGDVAIALNDPTLVRQLHERLRSTPHPTPVSHVAGVSPELSA